MTEVKRKKSVGEQIICKILDDLKLQYKYDQPFNDLRGVRNGVLRFDFILKRGSKVKFIEYNGIFHYHVINGKTSKYTLTKQQLNDFIKDEYCKRKKMDILWIPYWIDEKSIKQRIYDFLLK